MHTGWCSNMFINNIYDINVKESKLILAQHRHILHNPEIYISAKLKLMSVERQGSK